MRGLPAAVWVYVTGVATVALALIGTTPLPHDSWATLLVLALLFHVCDSAPVRLSLKHVGIALSYAASLAAVVLLGPAGAALVGFAAVFTGRKRAPIKRLFNGAQFALSGFVAAAVFQALGGTADHGAARWAEHILRPFVAADVAFTALNLILAALALRLSGQATWRELIGIVRQLAPGCVGFGMFGLLIAGIWPAVGPLAAVLVLLPLMIARWALAQTREQQEAYDATIAALCQAVETKDYYTRGHSERVSRGSVMIAEEIGMRPERVTAIRYAGMLHDVGKLGVPTKVLQKPGQLTDEEYAAVQLHPMRGLEIVKEIGFLDEALNGIMHHHEKMDGTGYPLGLAGDEIPEFARVISVADVFDTLTSTRSYRTAWTKERAVAELRASAGDHFDPAMVEAFIRALAHTPWEPPGPVAPPEDDEAAQTTQHDHDDPTVPLRVTGSEASVEKN